MPAIELPVRGSLIAGIGSQSSKVCHVWEQSMRYVFLVHRDEAQSNAISTRERDAFENECQANEQDLRQSGHLFAVEGLYSGCTVLTVQAVSGEVSVAETQGKLIRLFFINARGLNEAIQVASKMPQARSGPIEVRPIVELDQA